MIMENTIIAVYDSYAQAQNAMNELLSSGFSRSDVRLNPDSDRSTQTVSSDQASGSGIGHFFRALFGMEEHRAHGDIYSEAVRRGSVVLTVDAATEDQHERAVEVMNHYDPVDIDERSTVWRSQGWTGYDESAPMYTQDEIERERNLYTRNLRDEAAPARTTSTQEQTRIPVVEEELKVGKRVVQRGGVRVYQRLSEKPVHETVQLREEHVKVERHAVDQPATEADLAAFKEGSIELRETAEEPVVSKTAHVVEEVTLGKEVSQQTANIDDTLRRTDVEIEQLGPTSGLDDSDFRTHWQTAYGKSGGRYEDYDAAYRYGSTLAGSGRFKNYRWEDVEPDIRTDWESTHPGSTWDKVKDAVRYGAEKVTGKRRQ